MTGFALTNNGTPTTTSGATLTSSSFDPGAGGLVYVVVLDKGAVNPQTPPTDGTNSYNPAQESGFPNEFNTFYFYYSADPGTVTVSYTPQNVASGNAGMSVTLITGSTGVYDSSGSNFTAQTNNSSPTVSSNVAAGTNELAIATIGTTATSPFFSQQSGWVSPPNAITNPVNFISGNQTMSGTSTTYSPSILAPVNWSGIIDLFEPATVPAGLLLPPANIVVM